jgi:hypothetical protein
MEVPLNRVIAYGTVLELIGYGLNRIGDDHGQAVLAIAETMLADLEVVKKVWRKIMATDSLARRNTRGRPKPRTK